MLNDAQGWTPFSLRIGALGFAALVALAAPGSAAEEAHFVCRPTLLGLCRTTYAGPRGPEDAAAYLADATAAAEAALEAHPDLRSVNYRPGSGTVTALTAPGKTISSFALRQIADRFIEARLRIDRVLAPGSALSLRPGRDRGGRSRFLALSRHLVAGQGAKARPGTIEVVSFR